MERGIGCHVATRHYQTAVLKVPVQSHSYGLRLVGSKMAGGDCLISIIPLVDALASSLFRPRRSTLCVRRGFFIDSCSIVWSSLTF
jgi:hypothetical protein